jgi:hypothetical protein
MDRKLPITVLSEWILLRWNEVAVEMFERFPKGKPTITGADMDAFCMIAHVHRD